MKNRSRSSQDYQNLDLILSDANQVTWGHLVIKFLQKIPSIRIELDSALDCQIGLIWFKIRFNHLNLIS